MPHFTANRVPTQPLKTGRKAKRCATAGCATKLSATTHLCAATGRLPLALIDEHGVRLASFSDATVGNPLPVEDFGIEEEVHRFGEVAAGHHVGRFCPSWKNDNAFLSRQHTPYVW